MTADEIKTTAKDIGDRVSDRATGTVHSFADGVKDATGTYAGQANDIATKASEAAQELYGRARDTVQDTASRLPDNASDAWESGHRVYRKSSKQLARRVSKQPIEALLLAGAIGYLVGWATNRS